MISIVHIITGLGRGGAENALFRMVACLPPSDGFRHTVISLTHGSQFDFRSHGVEVHHLNLVRGAVPSVNAWRHLQRLIKDCAPHIVHSWMYHANVAASLATPSGVPLLWGIHHSLSDLQNEKPLTRLLIHCGKFLGRRVDKVHYCAVSSRNQHEELGYPKKSVLIPNGVDCEVFRPLPHAPRALREALALPENSFLFGHAARVHPVKNHAGLINSFGRIAPYHRNAWLLLAGKDVTAEHPIIAHALESVPAACRTRVRALGELDHMPSFYAGIDVSVLASHSEAFPNVLGESMACGVPCITTDVGDCAGIVGPHGFVVPPRQPIQLTSALAKALETPRAELNAMGERARGRIELEFSLSATIEKYRSLYQMLAKHTA